MRKQYGLTKSGCSQPFMDMETSVSQVNGQVKEVKGT
jgi:hypothetical protein